MLKMCFPFLVGGEVEEGGGGNMFICAHIQKCSTFLAQLARNSYGI